MIKGFGFFDACEYEPKPDNTAWIIKDILPKNAFGFVAGPPKGSASPHGGKSVFNRKMGLCTITGEEFMGKQVLEKGPVMFVNLDEDQDKQVRLYYRMTKDRKIPGYLISRATSCRLPEQMNMLEEDIKEARPLLVSIDPLQRVMGGKEVNEQSHVGPIIDGLKAISKKYECTIAVNHHSNKSKDRDKESTASWLSGSNDLDASWDFCLCIEHDPESFANRVRNFQKEKAKSDFWYEANIIHGDQIIDLWWILPELASCKPARTLYNTILSSGEIRQNFLSKLTNIPQSSVSRYFNDYPCIKRLVDIVSQNITQQEVNLIHEVKGFDK